MGYVTLALVYLGVGVGVVWILRRLAARRSTARTRRNPTATSAA